MEVEAAVVAIKTSASPKECDGYVVYPERAIMTYDQRFVVGHMSLLTSSLLKATK